MNEDQIEELEKIALLQFSISECATILGFKTNILKKIMSENEKVQAAYDRGRLMAIVEVRKAILMQARQGSTPAQKQMLEIITKNNKQAHKLNCEIEDLKS